jgi:phenylalanyl-tRNA synthetase beta chain
MKLSLEWLREFVDVDLPTAELARLITDGAAEVEGWDVVGGEWDSALVQVAEVVAVEPHPNADRLRLATVETGSGRVTVVCGAPNVAPGQKVAFAREGARLIDGHTGEPATLKLRPIRGVESAGMVLSEKELGLSDEHEGILVLPPGAKVGRPLVEELGDVIFDISTWANRADLLGVQGLAREVAALTRKPLREPDRSYSEDGPAVSELVSVSIEDPDLCRRFTASVIQGVTVGPSPRWMQERLRKHGMRPINNVVDITNYVMLETGQPLHAFDYDLVRGHRLVARRAKPGERLLTLDGVDRELDPDMLMICDEGGPVGVGGVIGGGNSEVSESTKNVLLEVANFKPGSIRRTSMVLKVRTEASLRFEKGIGPEMPAYVQARALHLFEQLAGGRVAKGLVDVYPGRQAATRIAVSNARVEQVLGMPVPRDEAMRIFEALGYGVLRASDDGYEVEAPPWRPDLEIADDVIEDLGRVYGYDKLPSTVLRGALPGVEPRPLPNLRERLRDLAVGTGLQEVITYSLTAKEKLEAVVAQDDARRREPLSVVNPVAAQHTWLRTSLRPSLLEAFAANRRHEAGALRMFEIGFEYLPAEADLPHERPVLCALLGGEREGRWPGASSPERLDFFDAKGVVEAILERLHIEARFEAAGEFGLLGGHTAAIRSGGEQVGVAGQVHPDVAAKFDIDEPVFLLELWLEELVRLAPERPPYAQPSRFPEVHEDLALLVDEGVPAAKVVELVGSARLVSGVSVFDEYRGPGIPVGRKSLALRVRYQAADRTLTDEDVARVRSGIVKRLERELGASLRGG